MTYELLTNLDGTTSLVRTNADGSQTWIPQDPANSDYQTYLLTPVEVIPLTAEQLELCQRYYSQITSNNGSSYAPFGAGVATSSIGAFVIVQFPVPMRVAPSLIVSAFSAFVLRLGAGTVVLTGMNISQENVNTVELNCSVASGLTTGQGTTLLANNTLAYLALNAEL